LPFCLAWIFDELREAVVVAEGLLYEELP